MKTFETTNRSFFNQEKNTKNSWNAKRRYLK